MTDGGYDDQGAHESDEDLDGDGTADVSLAEQTYASGKKYLLLEVPGYDRVDADAQTHPRTYLQLGAYPEQAHDDKKTWGDDLLDLAGVPTDATPFFKDDFRHQNSQQHKHPEVSYRRDDGRGEAATAGHDPLALTGELRSRGGWRQHTDGNYVSTVRGDRVDVIGGNYKLSVLGRMDLADESSPWGETYWESSGGHNRWATNTQGDRVMVEWSPRQGADCWRVYDETIKGDSIARYQGMVEEIYELRTKEQYVGYLPSEDGADLSAVGPPIASSSVSDTTGPHTQTDQAACWINPSQGPGEGRPRCAENPTITETVQATDIVESTKVTEGMGAAGSDKLELDSGVMWTRTSIAANKSDKTIAPVGAVLSHTTCDSGVTLITRTGNDPEDADALGAKLDLYVSTSVVGGKCSTEAMGYKATRPKGSWTFNIKLVGLTVDVSAATFSVALPNWGMMDERFFTTLADGDTAKAFLGLQEFYKPPKEGAEFDGGAFAKGLLLGQQVATGGGGTIAAPHRNLGTINLGDTVDIDFARRTFELNLAIPIAIKATAKLDFHVEKSTTSVALASLKTLGSKMGLVLANLKKAGAHNAASANEIRS